MSHIEAIIVNRPGAQCSVNEETGEIIDWIGPGDQPATEQVRAWKAAYAGPTPNSITMRQCRLQLLAMNKLASVEAAMAQASEAAKTEWEYAATVHRDNPIISSMMALLGADEKAADEFFRSASLL